MSSDTIRVLILEDSADDAELICRALRENVIEFTSRRVDTRDEFLAALEGFNPDIVLADYGLPSFNGESALRLARQARPDIPVVIVTGSLGDEKAVELLKLGAKDYVVKDRLARLGPAVRRALAEEKGIRRRKAAEGAILRERNFSTAALDSLPGLFYLIDDQGRFLRWNRNFEMVSGYSSEEVSHLAPTDLFGEPDKEIIAEKIRQVFVTGDATAEADFVGKDQTKTPYFFSGKLIQIDHKPCLVGMGIDITVRKRAERKFRDLLEAGPDASVIVDRGGRIVLVNSQAEAMFGYARTELLGHSVEMLLPGRYREKHPAHMKRYFANPTVRPIGKTSELLGRRKNGQDFPVEISLSPIETEEGTLVFSSPRDITARKQAEHELQRFRMAMDVSPDSMYLTDPAAMRFVYLNNTACQRLGYTREQLLHMGPHDVLSVGPEQIRRENDDVIAAGDRGLVHVSTFVKSDGTKGTTEIHSRALRTEEGTLIVTIGRDITERKRADEQVRRMNRVYAVLSGINTLIVRVHERQELFQESCRIAVEEGKFPFAWIGVLDPATQDVIPVASAGERSEELSKAPSSAREDSPHGKGAVGQAIRERRPVVNNDITGHSVGRPRLTEMLRLGYRSQITLPLFEGQTLVATLTMYARELSFFDEAELRLLTELAGDISYALDNFAKHQKLDKLARIRAVSSEINAAIVRIHDREALLRETCRIAVERGKFELVWIGLLDQEKQEVLPVAWAGISPDTAHAVGWASITTTRGTLSEAMLNRKPAVRNDIKADLTVGKLRQEALKKGCGSTVCLPLVVDDKVAALVALFALGVKFFDEEELALLDEVAANVSFALQAIEKQGRLDYLAYYDVLTGLANRSLFFERVAQYIRSAVSGGHKLAVGLIDLERFKNINDSLGQAAGDSLLKQVAEWLTRNLGDANLVARMGADHFAVVLPEVKQEGNVARLVEKLMAAFLDHPFRLDEAVFRVAVKVGVALFPDDGSDAGTLFKNAEAALKKAKTSGERYLSYTQAMTETVARKLTLENQLRQALEKEEFVLHYQPKVNLLSGKLTSAEALIRWNDPRTGLVPPGQFIPVLEEIGLISEVGRWALRKAIEDYLRWRAAGLAAVRIAVNVSPLQLRNRRFIAEIEQAIGVDAHAAAGLELEITESLIMADVRHSIASLQAIRAMGVSIAIDDFGTGFSSLSYLSKLPVDTLKIDRSFVIDMTTGPEGLALVSTIITLAHSLNLRVVAEGVETEEQSRLLRLLKCDEMQGYLFSKPVPAEFFETRFLGPPPAGS